MDLDTYLAAHPDTSLLEVVVTDLNGHPRGKWLAPDAFAKAFDGGLRLPLSTLALDTWGRDPADWVFDDGDADGVVVAESDTLLPMPWVPRPMAQVLASIIREGPGPELDPRRLLAVQVDALAAQGLRAVLAFEMEFHLFQAETEASGAPRHTQAAADGDPGPGGQTYSLEVLGEQAAVVQAIHDACAVQGLPVDTLITEGGASQYEVNLHHQDDALRAADQALLLRRTLKGVAAAHGLRASVMAKPFGDQPGNGLHVHLSLVDGDGHNVFAPGPEGPSPQHGQALAGLLATLPGAMLLLAPNANSWRRFQRGSHAPTAACWGEDNRTTALRVPASDAAGTRIEHRMAGADANPYLVAAALLAGVREGLAAGRPAPPPVLGNAYDQTPKDAPVLPRHWAGAIEAFREAEWVVRCFGERFQQVYAQLKEQELDTFAAEVTPLEYRSYL